MTQELKIRNQSQSLFNRALTSAYRNGIQIYDRRMATWFVSTSIPGCATMAALPTSFARTSPSTSVAMIRVVAPPERHHAHAERLQARPLVQPLGDLPDRFNN